MHSGSPLTVREQTCVGHKGLIKKANLTFAAMFLLLLVHNRLCPTTIDNMLTWDRAFLVAVLVDDLEVDLARLLISTIHERAFKASSTYPFVCMIFHLSRDAGEPIWHRVVLRNPNMIVDVGLIRDEANVVAPQRGPRVDVDLLSENSVDTVEQA